MDISGYAIVVMETYNGHNIILGKDLSIIQTNNCTEIPISPHQANCN